MTHLQHLAAAGLSAEGFSHGFSLPSLDLGIAPEGPDHQALARSVGYPLSSLRTCRQVHGASAVFVETLAPAERCDADALLTRTPALFVGIRTADCVSVLLGDRHSGAVAAVHAGWRGVVAGVLDAAISALAPRREGDLIAALGPYIGACCFEVEDKVAAQIAGASGASVLTPRRGARPHADLGAAVEIQLRARGVGAIEAVGGCTRCSPERWHSFRRDGERSGRMMAVIAARLR